MPQLFLDCDGVLADLNDAALRLFGADIVTIEARYGTTYLYNLMHNQTDFYFRLSLMPDALLLYDAVKHVKPIILTGHPNVSDPEWAIEQKLRWTAKEFPGVQTIVCPSRDKCHHMKAEGDVLVDDRLKYRPFWVDAGGVFVHHINVAETLVALKELEIL